MACAQRAVPGGAFFRGIDAFAREKLADPVLQAAFAGQRQQQFQCFGGDQVFGIIEQQVAGFSREARKTLRVGGKQFPQLAVLPGPAICRKNTPYRRARQ